MKVQLILVGIALMVVGGIVYYKSMPMTRNQAIKIIEDFIGLKFSADNTYDTAFLVARATAIKAGETTFAYLGKKYSSISSKAV